MEPPPPDHSPALPASSAQVARSRPHPVEHSVSESKHLCEGVEPAVEEGKEDE